MGHWKNDRYPWRKLGCSPCYSRTINGLRHINQTFRNWKGFSIKGICQKFHFQRLANVFLKESSEDVLRAGEIIITNPSGGAHYEGPDIQEIC